MSCNNPGIALGITSSANVAVQTAPPVDANGNPCSKDQQKQSMEAFIEQRAKIEDKIDYDFIQRVIQELTQSCALQLPIPASAIPPLIIQAAQFFWQNCDEAIEERYYCVKNEDFHRCGPNIVIKLPEQIVSVFGVNKLTDSIKYGVMGDFSLERMILNNSALASGAGGTLSDVFGSGNGYTLTDVTAALYEVYTFQAMFDAPLTYNFNQFSKELVILGELGYSDIILQTFRRLKIQDLYKNYYFFRLVVAFALRSMATIMGTMEFKLPGGVTINYARFQDMGNDYYEEVKEWVTKNHAADYFLNTSTV